MHAQVRNLCFGTSVKFVQNRVLKPCAGPRFPFVRTSFQTVVLNFGFYSASGLWFWFLCFALLLPSRCIQTKMTTAIQIHRTFCVSIDLSYRAASSQVLSAQTSLTSVFGMGTGGPSLLMTLTKIEKWGFFNLISFALPATLSILQTSLQNCRNLRAIAL